MNLEDRIAELEFQLDRERSAREIQNLMGRYTVNHTPATMADHLNFFAMELPDVSVEAGDRGVYYGPEGVRELYGVQFPMPSEGNLLIHFLASPMIEVAADGKSARGVWRSPGIEAVKPNDQDAPVPLWSFGSYAADFIRIDGVWKIHHLQWFRVIKCTFHDGWVDDLSMTYSKPMPESPNRKPTTFHNPYTPTSVQALVPGSPEPYETADGFGWALKRQNPALPKTLI